MQLLYFGNFSDLMTTGVSFKINEEDQVNDEFADEYDIDNDENLPESPWNGTFSVLRQTMEKVGNYLIYKKIIRKGYGDEILGTQNARVEYHYSAFLENFDVPFDSTYTKGRPNSMTTANCNVLPGVYHALITMCAGEEAQFLIDHSLLYGECGCPPRVPPKSECLFVIELKSYRQSGDEHALDNIDEADRNKFSVVYTKAEEVYKKALDSFVQKRYRLANVEFGKAIHALEYCTMESKQEELKQHDILVRLYRNQAVCFNMRQIWTKTCLMCKDLTYLSQRCNSYNIKNDCKAQFQWGRALLGLAEYAKAREHLKRAKELEPNNVEVSKELVLLDTKEQAAKKHEKDFAMRAARIIESVKITDEEKPKTVVSDGFQQQLKTTLIEFSEGNETELTLPDALDQGHIHFAKNLAENMNLKFKQRHIHSNRKSYIITKK